VAATEETDEVGWKGGSNVMWPDTRRSFDAAEYGKNVEYSVSPYHSKKRSGRTVRSLANREKEEADFLYLWHGREKKIQALREWTSR